MGFIWCTPTLAHLKGILLYRSLILLVKFKDIKNECTTKQNCLNRSECAYKQYRQNL